jgi:hypothetical protein
VVCGCLILALAAWFSGIPQRLFVRHAVRRALGAEASIEGLSIGRRVTVRAFTLRDPGHPEPFLSASGLSVGYSMNPFSKRLVREVKIDSLNLSIDARDPAATNLESVIARFRTGSGEEPGAEEPEDLERGSRQTGPATLLSESVMRFLPVLFSLGDLGITARGPGQEVTLRGIQASAAMYQADRSVLFLFSNHASGETVENGVSQSFENGRMRARFVLHGSAFTIEPVQADLPGVVEAEGRASGALYPGSALASASFSHLHLTGAPLRPFTGLLPVPVAFRSVTLSDSMVVATAGGGGLSQLEAKINGTLDGLIAGPPGAPWFAGDLGIKADAALDEADVTLALGEGRAVHIAANRDDDDLFASMRLTDWPGEAVRALIPPAHAAALRPLALLDLLSGEVTVSRVDGMARVSSILDGSMETRPGVTEGFAATLTGSAPFPPAPPFPLDADATLTMGGGTGSARIDSESLADPRVTATLGSLRLDALAWIGAGVALPDQFSPAVSGTIEVAGLTKPLVTGTLVLDGLGYDRSVAMSAEVRAEPQTAGALWPVSFEADTVFTGSGGRARIEGVLSDSAPMVEARASLNEVPLMALGAFAPPGTVPEGSAGLITGTTDFQRDVLQTAVSVSATLAGAVLGAWPLGEDPVLVETALTLANDLSAVTAPALGVRAGSWLDASLGNMKLQLDPFSVEGGLTARVDGPGLPVGLPLGGGLLGGTIDLAGPLRYNDGRLDLKAALDIEGLGYDTWQTSSGRTLVTELPLAYVPANTSLDLGPASGTWGDGVAFSIGKASGTVTPLALDIPFTMDADLALLAELGLVGTVEASHGDFTGTMLLTSEGFAVRLDGSATGELVALADALATTGGVSFEGTPEYGPGNRLGGAGRAGAISAAGFGVMLENIRTEWRGDGPSLVLEELSGGIFGGFFAGSIRIDPLDPTLPGEASLTFEGIDLARFTEEFKPGDVKLTGIASGSFSAQWTAAGLVSATFSMASEEGFSMNRDMIEQLLFSQYSEGMTGGKTLKDIREQILGESPQYSFDSASLDLSLDEGRFRGTAVFKSPRLNLTIDPAIDEQVLYEALRLRQEAGFDKLDAIRADPIEWRE